jgi:hypothetical protein
MPQFVEKDGRYCVSYITGPSHVWLGLRFGTFVQPVRIVQEPPIGAVQSTPIEESVLLQSVSAGIAEAAERVGGTLSLAEVSYVANDTPRAALYQYCAYLIATRVLQGGEFGGA